MNLPQELLRIFPSLRSEYIQVLVFVVAPMTLFLLVVVANLFVYKAEKVEGTTVYYKPSLAVRCGWLFGTVALIAGLMLRDYRNPIGLAGGLLMIEEMLRGAPGAIRVSPQGIRWFAGWRRRFIRWEDVYSYNSRGAWKELRLTGVKGERVSIFGTYYRAYSHLRANMESQLKSVHKAPLNPEPVSVIDKVHKVLLVVGLLMLVVSHKR